MVAKKKKPAPKVRQLDAKEARFVEEYLVDLDPRRAAIKAGYSKTMAGTKAYSWVCNGKTKPHVFAEITKARAKRSERTEITQDYVLNSIVETLGRCRQVEPVLKRDGSPVMVETKDGAVAPAFKFDAANALKAAELLGKHLVMFTDRVDHTSSDGTMATGNMTEDQIEAEIAMRLAKIEDERATVH